MPNREADPPRQPAHQGRGGTAELIRIATLSGLPGLASIAFSSDGRTLAANDLGVFNIAGALPFSIAPTIAPVILAMGGGSYGVLYAIAGFCAIIGAFAVLPVKRVR